MNTIYTIGLFIGPVLMIYALILFERDRKPAHRDFHYRLKHKDNEPDSCIPDSLQESTND
jgi:hypothetical protein